MVRFSAVFYLFFIIHTAFNMLLSARLGLPAWLYVLGGLGFLSIEIFCFRHFEKMPKTREVPITTEIQDTEHNELAALSSMISHEIKSPLRAIDGYARIFLEDYGFLPDTETRLLIENIRNICKETIELANMLLEYAHAAKNELNIEVIDLEGMIRDVFEFLNNTAGQTQLIFDARIPSIIGDAMLFRQAMVNIISNALKFTRDKDAPLIRVGYDLSEGEKVFYIRDNGAGFDMQYSDKLFSVFQRVHTSMEFEGSGLGLAIVKRIISLHKGRVWITGKVGLGATVYFTLPSEKVLERM
jgi:signal transduction histidine kinase